MVSRNTPEQKNRFLAAQARALQTQRSRRERSRPVRPVERSHVEVAAVEAAVQAAAAVDPSDAPPADDLFDPALFTVAEIAAYLEQHPDEVDAIVAAEKAGRGRYGVVALGDG